MDLSSLFARRPEPLPEGVELLETDLAKAKIDGGEFGLLVDVRSQEEWVKGRLPGALFAPITDINNYLGELKEHKGEEILLYCKTQVRSIKVARMLHEKGFLRLNVMNGGFDGWSAKGYSTVR